MLCMDLPSVPSVRRLAGVSVPSVFKNPVPSMRRLAGVSVPSVLTPVLDSTSVFPK